MTLLEALKQILGSKADEEVDDPNKKKGDPGGDPNPDGDPNPGDDPDDPNKKEPPAGGGKGDPGAGVSSPKKEEKKAPENNTGSGGSEGNPNDGGNEIMDIFEDGWMNNETGEIDESKIKNPEVLAAVQAITSRVKAERDQRMIADSLNNELKNYSLNVSEDTLRKVIDMSKVSIDKDNNVTGVKEALEALKTSEPGFFKDKEKESNPLNEGFNPVDKRGTDNISSFSQAFKLMEEIN